MKLAYVTVGVIVNTHGLRGETRVISRTEIPEQRFASGSVLQIRQPERDPSRDLTVASSRQHKQFWLVTFTDINNVQEAEKLKGYELCVPISELPELETGAYYIHDLIGLQVVTDAGKSLGHIKDVLTPGANDVYVVKRPGASDVLIPAIKDCILKVDLAEQQMLVHLLPGLVEDEG